MYTIQEVATEIEQLKPDFIEFIKHLEDDDSNEVLMKNIMETPELVVKVLKAEVALLYRETHQNRTAWNIRTELGRILIENLKNSAVNAASMHVQTHKYSIENSFDSNFHIMAHIQDQKPYLPKYLWDKVRTKKKLATEAPKQLQPNGLALAVFRNYVNTLKKPMTSITIMEYLRQLRGTDFSEYRDEYMEIIFTNTPSPSLEVQKLLSGVYNGHISIDPLPFQESKSLSKYMHLNRYQIKAMARTHSIPVSYYTYDTLDSGYKPFVTGLKRTPEKSVFELSYLFDALIVLQVCANKEPSPVYDYFIEELTKFLSLPEHTKIISELKQNWCQITSILPNLKF